MLNYYLIGITNIKESVFNNMKKEVPKTLKILNTYFWHYFVNMGGYLLIKPAVANL